MTEHLTLMVKLTSAISNAACTSLTHFRPQQHDENNMWVTDFIKHKSDISQLLVISVTNKSEIIKSF